MDIKLTLRGVTLTESETDVLRKKAEFAFDHYAERLSSVDVILEDFNGPRGGEDKVCRLVLHLAGNPAVILQERGSNTLAVGLAAFERAAQSLARRFEKNRTRRRALSR